MSVKGMLLLLYITTLLLLSSVITAATQQHCQYTAPCQVNDSFTKIWIAENGTDDQTCLNSGESNPCQSFSFVLNQLSSLSAVGHHLISIASDLNISSSINVSFSEHFSCLMIRGVGPVRPILSVQKWVSLTISSQQYPDSGSSLLIENVMFHFGFTDSDTVPDDYNSLSVSKFENVLIANVTVTQSNQWHLIASNNLTIADSVFYHNYYTTAFLSLTSTSVRLENLNIRRAIATGSEQMSFAFAPVYVTGNDFFSLQSCSISNCNITNSSTSNKALAVRSSSLFFFNLSTNTDVIISSCVFASADQNFTSSIFVQTLVGNVVISEVIVHDHSLGYQGDIIFLDTLDSPQSNITIKNSSFYRNYANVINCICEKCILGLLDFSVNSSQGRVLIDNSADSLLLSNINVSSMYNNPFSWIELFIIKATSITFSGSIMITGNEGTTFAFYDTTRVIIEERSSLNFVDNIGRFGGAISIYSQPSTLIYGQKSIVRFVNNKGILGGAIYIHYYDIQDEPICEDVKKVLQYIEAELFHFENNSAIVKGNEILIDFGSNPAPDIQNCTTKTISSVYYSASIGSLDDNSNYLTLFPGQIISFKANSTELLFANLFLTCNGAEFCPIDTISLSGQTNVVIPSGSNTVVTELRIKTALNVTQPVNGSDITFNMVYRTAQSNVSVIIRDCPLGFTFNNDTKLCQTCSDCSSEFYQASLADGITCVRQTYWFGRDGNAILQCYYPYCKRGETCTLKVDEPYLFSALPASQDDQCLFDKGGILCRQCKEGYKFTYLGIRCVKGKQCRWNLMGLILLAIVVNFLVGLLWITAVRFKGGATFGISLGPILFIAMGRLIPFGAYNGLKSIEVIFSFFSLLILDNSIFGYVIPACTPITTAVGQHSLNYIGPFVIVVMMAAILIASNCCFQYLKKLLENPLQTICLLGLLTFWSLASTSINLILPIKLGDSYRFQIDPNIPIHSLYALLWIIAIPVLVLVVGVTVFMMIAPFVARKWNPSRIRPFLDVCQSCYKDNWRWYPSVYFAVWIIVTCSTIYEDSNVGSLGVLIVVMSVHLTCHPYRFQWLNIVDTLLLMIIVTFNVVDFTTGENRLVYSLVRIIVHILAVLPFICYFVFVGSAIALIKVQRFRVLYETFKRKGTKLHAAIQSEDISEHRTWQKQPPPHLSRGSVVLLYDDD